MHVFQKIVRRLAKPDIAFWTLPWLMLLLTLGTVTQRDLGLYVAQKTFFSSWILWAGPVPLPGGYMAMAVLGVALACKFLAESKWSRRDAGVVLAHFGVLLLLAGGMMTALNAREGFMMVPEGGRQGAMEDYLRKVLTVTDADGQVVVAAPRKALKAGAQFVAGDLVINVLEYCHNCVPQERTEPRRGNLPFLGPAAQIRMVEVPPDLNEEVNHSAVTVTVRGSAGAAQDGIYLMTDVMPHQPQIDGYRIRFGRVEKILPFSIEMIDVRRELYPGTDMPRGYESAVIVHDGDVSWPVTIRMNEPLRYKGYTLYQSNYTILADGREASVFSVVRNSGWLFPYVASIVIAAGLIWHLAVTGYAGGSRRRTAES